MRCRRQWWPHRLVVATHLVLTLRAGAGVRLVCERLRRGGLSGILGSSYGSQHGMKVQVREAVVEQAQQQGAILAFGMEPREAVAFEDETFHPEIRLVAIEPVSDLGWADL